MIVTQFYVQFAKVLPNIYINPSPNSCVDSTACLSGKFMKIFNIKVAINASDSITLKN